MNDWQKRVIEEKESLDKKIKKLTYFLEKENLLDSVPVQEHDRLTYQLDLMMRYSLVLEHRINDFK